MYQLIKRTLTIALLSSIPMLGFSGNPYVLGWDPCPARCDEPHYLRCWYSCNDCNCDAGAQTTCGDCGPIQ